MPDLDTVSSDRWAADPPYMVHIEQLCKILVEQQHACLDLAKCAEEQQEALRLGRGADFVRSSLDQAHLARRFYFLEEERAVAVENLARILSADSGPKDLDTIMQRLPEADAERLSSRTSDLQKSARQAAAVQKVSAQMIQTNLQLAAALTRHTANHSAQYGKRSRKDDVPASKLDARI